MKAPLFNDVNADEALRYIRSIAQSPGAPAAPVTPELEAYCDAALLYGEHVAREAALGAFEWGAMQETARASQARTRATLDDAAWRFVFNGNAFERAPARNRRKPLWRLRRTLRALWHWLQQPSPWSTR